MPDVIVINTKPAPVRYEVRCPGFTTSNDLGVPGPLGKYSVVIQRIQEPQDNDGNQVGPRTDLPPVVIPDVVMLAAENYILRDGTKLNAGQILEAVNLFVDAHKAENIGGVGK